MQCSAAATGHAKVTLPVGMEAKVTLKSQRKSFPINVNGRGINQAAQGVVGNLTTATVGGIRGTAEISWLL